MGLSGAKWDQHYIQKKFFLNFKSDLYVIFSFNFFAKFLCRVCQQILYSSCLDKGVKIGATPKM